MIVCSCNVVSDREIHAVVEELICLDPDVVLTPGMVYRAIGIRPKCGTCLPHVVRLVHAHREKMQAKSTSSVNGASEPKRRAESKRKAAPKREPGRPNGRTTLISRI